MDEKRQSHSKQKETLSMLKVRKELTIDKRM
jgi:hypothetical protein